MLTGVRQPSMTRCRACALVAIVFLFAGYEVHNDKENARGIVNGVKPYLKQGELIISTHPEQTPVLRYYAGAGYRWATTLGPTKDPHIFDWRDAVSRLDAAKAQPTMDKLLATVKPGQEFVVIEPVFRDYRAWRAKWTKLVWRKATAWSWLLEHDQRYQVVAHVVSDEIALKVDGREVLTASDAMFRYGMAGVRMASGGRLQVHRLEVEDFA